MGVGKSKVEEETRGRRPETRGSLSGASLIAAHARGYLVGTIDGATSLGLLWGGARGDA